jgi:hypothetical protein
MQFFPNYLITLTCHLDPGQIFLSHGTIELYLYQWDNCICTTGTKLVQPISFELVEAILEICKEEVGDAPRKPISNFWYFDTVVKNHASTLVKRGVGRRSVSPAVCDCADPSHQFLRPHHTTITTNHNMQKNIPPRNKTPAAPTKHLPKTPSTPSNKEGGTDHKKDSEKARR